MQVEKGSIWTETVTKSMVWAFHKSYAWYWIETKSR